MTLSVLPLGWKVEVAGGGVESALIHHHRHEERGRALAQHLTVSLYYAVYCEWQVVLCIYINVGVYERCRLLILL